MRMFQLLGINDKRILTVGCCAEGKVTQVKTCYWLRVKTKFMRIHALDGAKFPHIIHFTYTVEGREYSGRRYVNWNLRCPVKDEVITVYYDAENPAKYAVLI